MANRKRKSKLHDITDILSEPGRRSIQVGHILIFKKGTKENHLKIITKANGKVWAEEVKLIHPDDLKN